MSATLAAGTGARTHKFGRLSRAPVARYDALMRTSLACLIVLATVLASARARAADDDEEGKRPKRESYFAISLAGGLLSPLGDMAGSGKLDLCGRVGYVGTTGFG